LDLITAVTVSPIFEAHFFCAAPGYDAFDEILPNLDDDMSHDSAKLEFCDFAFKTIA